MHEAFSFDTEDLLKSAMVTMLKRNQEGDDILFYDKVVLFINIKDMKLNVRGEKGREEVDLSRLPEKLSPRELISLLEKNVKYDIGGKARFMEQKKKKEEEWAAKRDKRVAKA